MTKQEIIEAVAYVNAPENARILTRSLLSEIEHSSVVSELPALKERRKMALAGFLEITFLMNTRRLPDKPTSTLFERLHRVILIFQDLKSNPPTGIDLTTVEIDEQVDAMTKKLQSLAVELKILYFEPGT